MEVYQLQAILSADYKSFQKGMQEGLAAFENFKKSAGTMKDVGSAVSGVGKAMTLGLTTPIVGIGVASLKAGSDFEAGMSKVQAISGANSDEMAKLTELAEHMGATTKFSATQSAEALSYMGMAGWKADQMIAGLPGIMNLAAASGEDLGLVSDIVTDSLSAFGLGAEDAGRYADILAAAATNSNTNVAMMGETFKYAAPLAGTLGYSVEDTAVAIGLMANSGIKGSQAGTSLRSAFTRLASPTKEVIRGMDILGLSIEDVQGLSLDETLTIFRRAFANLDETQQAQAASLIFGRNAMSGMLAIINTSEEDYNKLSDAIYNSNGAAENMAKIMQDNLQGSFVQLKSALEGAGIAISKTLAPKIREIIDKFTEWVRAFNELSPEQQDFIVKVGLLVAAIGPLLLILGGVIGKFKDMTGTVKLLAGGFSKLFGFFAANPWLLLVAGLAIVAVEIYKHWDEIKEFLSQTWQAIKEGASNLWEGITEKVAGVVDGIKEAWSGFKEHMAEIWSNLKSSASTAWENIKTAISEKVASIKEAIQSKFTEIGENAKATWESLKESLSTIWENLKTTAKEKWDSMKTSISETTTAIKEKLSSIWESIKTMIKEKWDGIVENVKTSITTMKENISSTFDTIKQTIKDKTTEFYNTVKEAFTKMVATVKEFIAKIPVHVREGFQQAISAGRKFITDAVNVGKDLIMGFVNGVKAMADRLINAVTGAVSKAVNGAKKFLRIGSPSKLFKQYGMWTMQGFSIGIGKEERATVRTMEGAMKGIADTYEPLQNVPQLGNLKSNVSSTVDYNMGENQGTVRPLDLNLTLGNRNFRLLVDDISKVQGKEMQLVESYSF